MLKNYFICSRLLFILPYARFQHFPETIIRKSNFLFGRSFCSRTKNKTLNSISSETKTCFIPNFIIFADCIRPTGKSCGRKSDGSNGAQRPCSMPTQLSCLDLNPSRTRLVFLRVTHPSTHICRFFS